MKFIVALIGLIFTVSIAYGNQTVFSVQVLTARSYERAFSYYTALRHHPYVRIEEINQKYVVRLGAYRDRHEALALLNQLRQSHPDAIILSCYIIESRIEASSRQNLAHVKKTLPPAQSIASQKPTRSSIHPLSPPSPSKETASELSGSPTTKPETDKPPQLLQDPDSYFIKGTDHYQNRRYALAIASLSHYLSIVPESRQRVSAMMVLGRCLNHLNRPRAALSMFSRILEKFPQSPEATLSIVAMADIGLNRPELKYPIGCKGSEFFMDPLLGYDAALSKSLPRSTIEYVHYQKGQVFQKKEQYLKAYLQMSHLLTEFPQSLYRTEIVHSMKSCASILIDQYQQSEDHLSVVNLFLQAKQGGAITADDSLSLLKVSVSLAHLGFQDEALAIVTPFKNSLNPQLQAAAKTTLTMIASISPSDVANHHKHHENWNLFERGRDYLASHNLPLAEKVLTKLKDNTDEPFWSKLSDYAIASSRWNQKYQKTKNQ